MLAPEVVLTFESELQRGLLLRFLALADLGRVDRERSARILQRAARAFLAKRETERLRRERGVIARVATCVLGRAGDGNAKKLSERHEIHRLLCGELNELARAHHEEVVREGSKVARAQDEGWMLEAHTARERTHKEEEVHV